MGHHPKILSFPPAQGTPEPQPFGIARKYEGVTFRNTQGMKTGSAGIDQGPADSSSTARGTDGQVIDVAPPAVMAAEKSSHDRAIRRLGHEAETGVALQKKGQMVSSIGVAEANMLRVFPKGDGPVIIADRHFFDPVMAFGNTPRVCRGGGCVGQRGVEKVSEGCTNPEFR